MSEASAEDKRALLERGATLGKYVVLESLGEGSMGAVYAAFDIRLERKVALKVVKPVPWESIDGPRSARLILEAQAMARLSHPNIVTVYDVQSIAGQIFIAMEYVQGITLREWLDEGAHPWPTVLRHFKSAGEGLAAAHAAGLVHRDFKPENVLVGSDGRVRVTDFGLARLASSERAHDPIALPLGIERPVTATGATMGTPEYMAPEQHDGAPATATTDQFAFSIAFYEALYGARPPAAEKKVPAWLRRIVGRGLSPAPGDRFPCMRTLLSALRRGQQRALGRRLVGLAALGLLALAVVIMLNHARQAICKNPELKLRGVWDAARKVAIHRSFSGTKLGYAESTWSSVERMLDRYAVDWQAAHVEVCIATRISQVQSQPIFDAKMQCLERAKAELKALTDVYLASNERLLERAVQSASALLPIRECSRATLHGPRPAAMDTQRERIEGSLARVKVLYEGGLPIEGLKSANALVADIEAGGDRRLEAEARYYDALLTFDNGDVKAAEPMLFRAFATASEMGDDRVAALSAIHAASVAATRLADPERADRWLSLAHANVARFDEEGDLAASLYETQGLVLSERGQFEPAIRLLKRAVALRDHLRGDDFQAFKARHNLAYALAEAGALAEAERYSRENLEFAARVFGENHPSVARAWQGLGSVATTEARYAEAIGDFRHALAIREAAYPADHPDIGETIGALGNALAGSGDSHAAIGYLARAIAILDKKVGKKDVQLGMYWAAYGDALRDDGDLPRARVAYNRSFAILRESPDRSAAAVPLIGIGEFHFRVGQVARALEPLKRAVALLDTNPVTNQNGLATARFLLAQALWANHQTKEALRMAALSRRDWVDAHLADGADLKAVDVWLNAHANRSAGSLAQGP